MIGSQLPSGGRFEPATAAALAVAGVVGAATLWSFWPTLGLLAERWSNDPQYSHGYLVPVFAAVILFLKRPAELTWRPNAWGLLILVASVLPRILAARLDMTYVDGACLIGTLLGLSLLIGGWDVFRWTAPSILFLGFMIPLPDMINDAIAIPLRRLATIVSTYVLQTFGYPALAEGNTIHIEQIHLGVVEACSGLGMLMTFIALATAMALVAPGPVFDRVVLVISSVPIAVFANVLRITITGMAYYSLGLQPENREEFHKILGWLMMPLALILLWSVLKFLGVLLISTDNEAPLKVPLSPWLEKAKAKDSKPLWS